KANPAREAKCTVDRLQQDGDWTFRVTLQHVEVPVVGGQSFTNRPKVNDKPFLRRNYPKSGRVKLIEQRDGSFLASFREVHAAGVGWLRRELGADWDSPCKLKRKLFFVGGGTASTVGAPPLATPHVRFERGYGSTLLVPYSQVLLPEGPFSDTQVLMFHGDWVSHLTFEPGPDPKAPDEGCRMRVHDHNVTHSDGRVLYNQARAAVVHVLRLSTSPKVTVRHVEGLAQTPQLLGGAAGLETECLRPFEVSAFLDKPSHKRLSARLKTTGSVGPCVFGRLNKSKFEETQGRELEFKHVRMDWEPSGPDADDALHDQERIFIEVSKIFRGRNEVSVSLTELHDLDPLDVGGAMSGRTPEGAVRAHTALTMPRRAFSAREDVLKRILNEHGADALAGQRLLVRLDLIRGRTHASLAAGGVMRSLQTLATAIELEDGPFMAIVHTAGTDSSFVLELRPGAFVALAASQLTERPPPLDKGAVVQVLKVTGGERPTFRLRVASFSDSSYVPAAGRPAVVFPMNMLFWKANEWNKRPSFTVGGLPGLPQLTPSYVRPDGTLAPLADDLVIGLMGVPHPKTGWVLPDSSNALRAISSHDGYVAGALSIEHEPKAPPRVAISPLGEEETRSIEWHLQTFADESAGEVAKRVKGHRWTYHDEETVHWDGDRVRPTNLSAPSGEEGPLFFATVDSRDGQLIQLRYPQDQLRRFGFPVWELIQALSENVAARPRHATGTNNKGGSHKPGGDGRGSARRENRRRSHSEGKKRSQGRRPKRKPGQGEDR
ncbi:hypothetical protein OAX78_03385, partial [Planctomycetota bacterium]|nr:hypothetical protein [Planctomycetota bacterium]